MDHQNTFDGGRTAICQPSTLRKIKLTDITIDDGIQSRAKINPAVVADYQAAMEEGAAFPPVVVFSDGVAHWLADGFHRFDAAQGVGFVDLDAEVRQGTRRDAILHSVLSNVTHGLRRSNADKRRAVEMLLKDEEWATWSDREIARWSGVSNNMVGEIRKAICHPMTDDKRTSERNGKPYSIKTGGIAEANHARASKPRLADEPGDESEAVPVVPVVPATNITLRDLPRTNRQGDLTEPARARCFQILESAIYKALRRHNPARGRQELAELEKGIRRLLGSIEANRVEVAQ